MKYKTVLKSEVDKNKLKYSDLLTEIDNLKDDRAIAIEVEDEKEMQRIRHALHKHVARGYITTSRENLTLYVWRKQ